MEYVELGYQYLKSSVSAPNNYTWHLIDTIKSFQLTIYKCQLQIPVTEQIPEYADKLHHTHGIYVYVPITVINQSHIFIKIGSGCDITFESYNQVLMELALSTGCIGFEVFMVPNQPIDGACEDEMMAYFWKKYIETENLAYIINYTMAKSIYYSVEFANQFIHSHLQLPIQPKAILYGASKRALAIWLAATIIPSSRLASTVHLVYDNLNTRTCMQNQFDKTGLHSSSLDSYHRNGLLGESLSHHLYDLIDPLSYFDRIPKSISKSILNAANDNYFTPDSSLCYYDKISECYLRYVPNVRHSLPDKVVVQHLKSVLMRLYSHYCRPVVFEFHQGRIQFQTEAKKIRLWWAENDEFDFGMRHFVEYQNVEIEEGTMEINLGDYVVQTKRWLVVFTELIYEDGFVETSPVYVMEKR